MDDPIVKSVRKVQIRLHRLKGNGKQGHEVGSGWSDGAWAREELGGGVGCEYYQNKLFSCTKSII